MQNVGLGNDPRLMPSAANRFDYHFCSDEHHDLWEEEQRNPAPENREVIIAGRAVVAARITRKENNLEPT